MPSPKSSSTSANAEAGNDLGSVFAHKMRAGWLPAGVHTWRTADGTALFHRLRFVRPLGHEPGRPLNACTVTLHYNGRAWCRGEPPAPPQGRPLFMLPELLAAPVSRPVYWVWDESAAAALSGLGLPATTASPNLAVTDWSPLRGRCLRLWPVSSGIAARRQQRELAAHLRQLGCTVEELEPAGPSPDTAADPVAATIAALDWQAQAARRAAAPSFLTVRAEEVPAESVRWLWPGRIALGKLTLIVGDPDQGKSVLTVDLAARVTRGAPWPVSGEACPRGEVLLVSDEDNTADTVRPRLDAAGADVNAVHILRTVTPQGQGARRLDLQQDLEGLANFLAAHPNVRLVCLDPLTAYLGESDSHRNAAMRALLQPLGELAAQAGVAIVAVLHLNKSGHRASSLYRVSGSLAFVAIARASFLVTKDPAHPERRLLLPSKNNLGQQTQGLAYRITPAPNGAPRITWEPEPVTITADQALAGITPEDPHPELTESAAWLRELLAETSLPATEVKKAATQAGLPWRTVQRAKKPAGITSQRSGFGPQATYTWHLHPQPLPACVPTKTLGTHGTHEENPPENPCVPTPPNTPD